MGELACGLTASGEGASNAGGEPPVKLVLIGDGTEQAVNRPARPAAHWSEHMAHAALCTWSTPNEPEHTYYGVVSYCRADVGPSDAPRYFASQVAYQAYREARSKYALIYFTHLSH